MQMMDLRRLSHLVALAEELHFGRAADRVHLSISAFSRSIQAAEADWNVPIFEREAGSLHVTPAGKFLIQRAQKLLSNARSMQRDMDLYRDSQLGDIAFGIGPMAGYTFMRSVLIELHSRYPAVNFKIEQTSGAQLLERLLSEKIEFFVADIRSMPKGGPIEVHVLPSFSLNLFARAAHPLAGQKCLVKDVWKYGVCSVVITNQTRRILSNLLPVLSEEDFRLAIECDDVSLLRSMVLGTDISMISSSAALQADIKDGSIVQLDVEDLPTLKAAFAIVSLRGRTRSPMAEKAIDCLQKIAITCCD